VTIRIRLDGNLAVIWKKNKLLVKELTNTQGKIIRDVA
jgi:ribosomal protein S17E